MHSTAAGSTTRCPLASSRGSVAVAAAVPTPRSTAAQALRYVPQRATILCRQQSSVIGGSSDLGLSQRQCRSLGSSSPVMQRAGSRADRSRRMQPCAAAGEAADSGSQPPPPMQQQKKKPRPMSAQQRWRAAKFAVQEAVQRLSETPAVLAVLAALAALNRKLQPLYDVWAVVCSWQAELTDAYNAFIAEETKRQWRWSKQFAKELVWWTRVPPYMGFFAATLLYQAFMPVSLAASVAVPLYYSWVLWDSWWVSPVFLATLLVTPMKWLPWADKCLVWPGLI